MNDYVETPPPERAAPVALPEPPPATSSSHAGSPQRQRSNSLYDLFLTAVGLTPRGVETSPPGSQPAEDEEEFWSAVDDNDVREFGGATTSSASNTPSERQMTPRQPAGHSQREIAQTAMTTGPGGDGGDASRPLSTSRARLAAEYPASGSDGLDGPDNQTEDGLPRRRRRWFRVQVVSADTSGPSNPRNQPRRPPRRFSLRNPLFQALPGASSHSRQSSNTDGYNSSANAGTRAIERAVNGVASSGGGGSTSNGVGAVGAAPSASDSETGQGRVLFYHKPTLANVPTGDVPDSVPVYLGCPKGDMALGLPLNEAWQRGEQQDTTFDQNLSYTILSWPEDHISDVLELWRLQILLSLAMIFNILVAALLFFAENPDRTRVEGPARAGALPGPFEKRNPSDEPTGIRSQEWHLGAVLLIGVVGIVSVTARIRAGVALFLCLMAVNAVVGLSHAPDPLYACRFAIDFMLVVIGRSYLSKLTYSWVTASAGETRRPW